MLKMSENIFSNWFSLRFNNREFENKYNENKEASIRKFNKYVTSALFITSIGLTIGFSFFLEEKYEKEPIYRIDMFTTYITVFVYFILIFISFLVESITVIKWVQYVNYFFLSFIGINFRYIVLTFSKVNMIMYYILYTAEILIRLGWIMLGLLGFVETFIINFIQSAIIWAIFLPNLDDNSERFENTTYSLLAYCFALIIVFIFAYILERQKKNAFYYNTFSNQKATWFENIFENMNTGFISFKGDNLTYVNSYLLAKIEKSRIVRGSQMCESNNQGKLGPFNTNSENNFLMTNGESVKLKVENKITKNGNVIKYEKYVFSPHDAFVFLNWLLTNLNIDGVTDTLLHDTLEEFKRELVFSSSNKSDDRMVISKFRSSICKIPGIDKFFLIGDASIETENCEYNYEIYCRMNFTFGSCELDFLFNDVTRTKLIEKQNAEFQYKTLFLSKVAHEFKNPLICISEIITDIFENLEIEETKSNSVKMKTYSAQDPVISNNHLIFPSGQKINTYLKSTLSQIKSLSNFLLVLVKDLNFFSQIQMNNKIELENSNTNFRDLVKFCKEITESLLKKTNKENSVTFSIKIQAEVPRKLKIDEWRLKQVLINLLSNAVKFTLYGEIALEITMSEDKKKIKFLVRDTGIGIREEAKKNLFKPFAKGGVKLKGASNELGSGLGLSIVYELTQVLGASIHYSSEFEKGSSFWFYLDVKEVSTPKYDRKEEDQGVKSGVKSESASKCILDRDISNSSSNKKIISKAVSQEVSVNNSNLRNPLGIVLKTKNSGGLNSLTKQMPTPTNSFEDSRETVKLQDLHLIKLTNSKGSYGSFNSLTSDLEDNSNNLLKKSENKKSSKFINEMNSSKNLLNRNENFTENIKENQKNNIQNIDKRSSDRKPTNSNVYSISDILNSDSSYLRGSLNGDFINVMVTDDEVFTRKSAIRAVLSVAKEIGVHINIIESEDGVESVYLIYKCLKLGIKISIIFSDEYMPFLSGLKSSVIISDMLSSNHLSNIPFFLVTAYHGILFENGTGTSVNKVLPKPLSKTLAKEIIEDVLRNS